jgi:hypothetical protein
MILGLIGTAAQIDQALYVDHLQMLRSDGAIFYAPDRMPSLTLTGSECQNVHVLTVSDLDDYVRSAPLATGGTSPSPGAFQSSDFRGAYLGGSGSSCDALTGDTQSVGVFAPAGFDPDSIGIYETATGLTGVPPVQIKVAGVPDGTAGSPFAPDLEGSTREISADIEMIIAMAPKAHVVAFEGLSPDLILDAMVNSPEVSQLNMSWFIVPTAVTPQLFTIMAAQGQSFFVASNDFGPYPVTAVPASPTFPGCNLLPPNSIYDMPWITLVGGTELNTLNGVWQSETSWVSSGGGILNAPIPTYQLGLNLANTSASPTLRNAPDVAMPASSVYIVTASCCGAIVGSVGFPVSSSALCTGCQRCDFNVNTTQPILLPCEPDKKGQLAQVIGGTSVSSPLWAGFTALINQKNKLAGQPTAGFINPAIYAIGRGPNYSSGFNDIPAGPGATTTMSVQPAPGCDGTSFSDQAGYDLLTGWGSPRCGLIDQLAQTQPSQPKLVVNGKASEQPLAAAFSSFCGSVSGFTPGTFVNITFTNIPGPSGVPRDPITSFNKGPVAADGTLDFTVGTDAIYGQVLCSPDQGSSEVTVTATSNTTQEIAQTTFTSAWFCIPDPPDSFPSLYLNGGCN